LLRKGVPKDKIRAKTGYLHWLRHSRLTYIAQKYNFNDSMLRHYVGWGSAAMALKYIHLKPEDILTKMKIGDNI
jgi:hypothetical protein